MTDKQIKEINEEIKKAIRRIENIWKKYDELREKYKAKEQECEELKKFLNEGCLHNLTLMTEQRVLLQTLTEIKEIAKICKSHNVDCCYECKYFDDCEVEDAEIPTRDVCKLILNKISECEGNDD